MTKQVEGTVRDLYRMRAAYAAVGRTLEALETAGLDGAPSRELYNDLGTTEVFIPVPCLVCKKGFPIAVLVADEGWPQAVLCETCDAKIMDDVGKLEVRPRRRRRTRAEMEAARAAEQESKNA